MLFGYVVLEIGVHCVALMYFDDIKSAFWFGHGNRINEQIGVAVKLHTSMTLQPFVGPWLLFSFLIQT
jgi:hypothetical protein